MIEEYLKTRRKILNEIIEQNREKYEHNQIAIAEAKKQIDELENNVDEAQKIFSVKAREDSDFNNKEKTDLENRIAAYVIDNKQYNENIEITKKELKIVSDCIDEIEKQNVSRETSDMDGEFKQLEINVVSNDTEINDNVDLKQISQKLLFCKSIAEIDGKRVKIEIEKIIKEIIK